MDPDVTLFHPYRFYQLHRPPLCLHAWQATKLQVLHLTQANVTVEVPTPQIQIVLEQCDTAGSKATIILLFCPPNTRKPPQCPPARGSILLCSSLSEGKHETTVGHYSQYATSNFMHQFLVHGDLSHGQDGQMCFVTLSTMYVSGFPSTDFIVAT